MDDVADTLCGLEHGASKSNGASRDSECFCSHIRGGKTVGVRLERVGVGSSRGWVQKELAGCCDPAPKFRGFFSYVLLTVPCNTFIMNYNLCTMLPGPLGARNQPVNLCG